jgi:Fe-S-cluster-containing dehydrogenase component
LLYDATVCIGCKACVSACKEYNEMPPEFSSNEKLWDTPLDLSSKTLNVIKLYESGKGSEKDSVDGYSYVKRQCMHCVDPACVSACPVTALRKDATTGIVSYDKGACIGCRYCQIACPFNIPKFEFDKAFPVIRKCQLCNHRYESGNYAACAQYCPTGATVFGKTSDLLAEARRRLELKPGEYAPYPVGRVDSKDRVMRLVTPYTPRVYGETGGGGTQCFMLAGVPFEFIGMPKLSAVPDAKRSETLQHTVYKGMIAPTLFLAGLIYVVKRNTKEHK